MPLLLGIAAAIAYLAWRGALDTRRAMAGFALLTLALALSSAGSIVDARTALATAGAHARAAATPPLLATVDGSTSRLVTDPLAVLAFACSLLAMRPPATRLRPRPVALAFAVAGAALAMEAANVVRILHDASSAFLPGPDRWYGLTPLRSLVGPLETSAAYALAMAIAYASDRPRASAWAWLHLTLAGALGVAASERYLVEATEIRSTGYARYLQTTSVPQAYGFSALESSWYRHDAFAFGCVFLSLIAGPLALLAWAVAARGLAGRPAGMRGRA